MDEYFAAKMRLFEMTARDGGDMLIYRAAPGGQRAARFVSGLETTGRVRLCDEPLLEPSELAVPAYFHRINATLALLASGRPENDPGVRAALEVLPPIPGRYTLVRESGDSHSRYGIVDYAHSPDGLENVLQAARAEGIRALICVFGCGGDRDTAKRPLMGAIAARLADAIIITDDNPRGEDPAVIRAAIRAGIERELEGRDPAAAPEVFEIGDRRAAIQAAVDWIYARAELPAVALVAGKGHESVQIFADRREPFSDALVLEESLRARGNRVEALS
jgi:UDP-N-acetylmuramoyl-L-alanyl-D-glutamate--2,6-diaminopimelate ligase